MNSEIVFKKYALEVDQWIEKYFNSELTSGNRAILELKKAMQYSASNGGKRFRPVISLLIADLFQISHEIILPFAAAVEFIHTYSLIHDDLPCMDNDDFRRGQPTNHKVFGEAIALLAGDALLTESFSMVSQSYEQPLQVKLLVRLLCQAAGVNGMVGGQAIDLAAEGKDLQLEQMTELHLLKTGAMIRVAAEGAAVISNTNDQQRGYIRDYAEKLGLAFQIADDILDYEEKNQLQRSFVGLLGVDGCRAYLQDISNEAKDSIRKLRLATDHLEYLIDFNLTRKH